jgi:hypothetical protein
MSPSVRPPSDERRCSFDAKFSRVGGGGFPYLLLEWGSFFISVLTPLPRLCPGRSAGLSHPSPPSRVTGRGRGDEGEGARTVRGLQ